MYAAEWKDTDLTVLDPGFGVKHPLSPAAVITADAADEMCISHNATIQDPQTSVYCSNGVVIWQLADGAATPTAFGYQDEPVFYGSCQVFDPQTETVRVVPNAAVLLGFCQEQFGNCPWQQ